MTPATTRSPMTGPRPLSSIPRSIHLSPVCLVEISNPRHIGKRFQRAYLSVSVAKNILLTGPPGCGKTTVASKAVRILSDAGLTVGGLICPEIRVRGTRVGFEIIDLLGGRGILAHISGVPPDMPRVSRYRVNLPDLDRIARAALERKADVLVIDEIGPMELKSDVFKASVLKALGSATPVIAAVHFRTDWGFIGGVKQRRDTKVVVVTPQNRDLLPSSIAREVMSLLGR